MSQVKMKYITTTVSLSVSSLFPLCTNHYAFSLSKAKQHLGLLCLGEIGRRKDLSIHAHIENIVIESFQSPFEEIKSAASYALGNIAVGNLPKYLPFILDQIDNQQKKQYLLLHSLKEVCCLERTLSGWL